MSTTEVAFKSYRKNIKDLFAPSGVLLACGYIRQFDSEIPGEISFICSQFLDLYLGYEPTQIKYGKNYDSVSTWTELQINKAADWIEMTEFDKRLLRDFIVFDSKKAITQIQCEVKTQRFGEHGARWIAPIIKNAPHLTYINLSNCYLNDYCVEIICESITESRCPKLMLDISDNYQLSDKSMEHLLSVMDRLIGINLNCTQITDKSCAILCDYFHDNTDARLVLVKLDGNPAITEEGKAVLREVSSRISALQLDE